MIHIQNNDQIWIVGGIEPEAKKESFDIINIGNSTNLRIFLMNHMEVDTLAKTDGWRKYDFLDSNESILEN